jgi:hypothetical protein
MFSFILNSTEIYNNYDSDNKFKKTSLFFIEKNYDNKNSVNKLKITNYLLENNEENNNNNKNNNNNNFYFNENIDIFENNEKNIPWLLRNMQKLKFNRFEFQNINVFCKYYPKSTTQYFSPITQYNKEKNLINVNTNTTNENEEKKIKEIEYLKIKYFLNLNTSKYSFFKPYYSTRLSNEESFSFLIENGLNRLLKTVMVVSKNMNMQGFLFL